MGELGYLDDPAYELGMLAAQAMRAVRVIVDIGMHLELPIPADERYHPGERWTPELALPFVIERSAASPRTSCAARSTATSAGPARRSATRSASGSGSSARAEAQSAHGRRLRPQGVPLLRARSRRHGPRPAPRRARALLTRCAHRVRSRCRRRCRRRATPSQRTPDRPHRAAPIGTRSRPTGCASVRPTRTSCFPVPVVGGPDELEFHDDDVVLLGVKSQDTFGADRGLAAPRPRTSRSCALQNGVANERDAAARVRRRLRRLRDGADGAHRARASWRRRRTDHRDPRHRPLPVAASTTPRRGRRRALGLRLRLGAAARHHAVEVHEAADEPRQRGRRDVPPGARTRASWCDRARAEGVAALDAAGIDAASRRGRPGPARRPPDGATDRGCAARRRVELAEPRPRHRRDRGRLPQRRDRVGGPVSGTRHARERGALRVAKRMAREKAPPRTADAAAVLAGIR